MAKLTIAQLTKRLDTATEKLEAEQVRTTDLEKQLSAASSDKGAQEQVEALQAEIASLKTDVDVWEGRATDQREKTKTATDELKATKAELATATEALEAAQAANPEAAKKTGPGPRKTCDNCLDSHGDIKKGAVELHAAHVGVEEQGEHEAYHQADGHPEEHDVKGVPETFPKLWIVGLHARIGGVEIQAAPGQIAGRQADLRIGVRADSGQRLFDRRARSAIGPLNVQH